MAKKLSISARIRALLEKDLSVAQIAKKLDIKPAYVYQVRWQDEQKAKNKKKAKTKRKDVIVDVDVPIKIEGKDMQYDAGATGIDQENRIESPYHYTVGGIEVWDFIAAKDLNYNLGNVVKYVSRCDYTEDFTGIEDLRKARQYLDREIAQREKDAA